MSTCMICEYSKPREDCGVADFWHLTGYKGIFWGTVCEKCMYIISPPNGRPINQEEFNKVVAIYLLKH